MTYKIIKSLWCFTIAYATKKIADAPAEIADVLFEGSIHSFDSMDSDRVCASRLKCYMYLKLAFVYFYTYAR
jgi:hypothetical protein